MIAFLRFLSIANVAVWFGAAVFTVVALPAVFSGESAHYLQLHAGFAAEAIMGRYFILQYCCAAIALSHLAIEWLYLGRASRRFTVGLLIGLACMGLLGGLVAQPQIHQLYLAKNWSNSLQAKAQASKSFKIWHASSEVANLLVVMGLVVYLWRIVKSADSSRFVGSTKIRS